jgi:hypothetical protein
MNGFRDAPRKILFASGGAPAYFMPALSDGVTVAQGPLEAFVMVRIHVGQPITSIFALKLPE